MQNRRKRSNREIIGLTCLFVVFVASLLLFERVAQETVPHDTPSTLNPSGPGAKALFLLLQKEGFAAERIEAPWTALNARQGLLVVIEPLREDRAVSSEELDALKSWIESGGTVLFMVTLPKRDLDKKDLIAGDVAIILGDKKAADLKPFAPSSPYVQNVSLLHVESPVRLKTGANSHYQTLFKDEQGALAVQKPMGKGNVLLIANSIAASNATIQQADNAILLVNIAAETTKGSRKGVVFDEYHHGVGFETRGGEGDTVKGGMFENSPKPLRFALLHLCALGVLLLYVGNRRFGPIRTIQTQPYRPSTDYVGSMARLIRRANAGDIAIVTLYRHFQRDLRRQLDLTPDTPTQTLISLAVRKYGVPETPFVQFLTTCEEISNGKRVDENAMLHLARELDTYRRSFHLGGYE